MLRYDKHIPPVMIAVPARRGAASRLDRKRHPATTDILPGQQPRQEPSTKRKDSTRSKQMVETQIPSAADIPPYTMPAGSSHRGAPAQYFPISAFKLVLMSVITFGIYELYWFYKNWKYVKQRDESEIWPFWRAVFSVFWFFPLIKDIDDHTKGGGSEPGIALGLLALGYFLLNGAGVRLPDPYWLISDLTVLCLLPIALQINRVNQASRAEVEANSRFRIWQIVVLLLLSPLWLIVHTSALYLTPSAQVVTGSKLWPWQVDFLHERQLLDEDERVLYFYSTGTWSVEAEGNVVTTKSVVSYEQDYESGELVGDYAYYEEIADIEPAFSESWLEDSVITIRKIDGTEFLLFAPSDNEQDHQLVSEIENQIRNAQGPQ